MADLHQTCVTFCQQLTNRPDASKLQRQACRIHRTTSTPLLRWEWSVGLRFSRRGCALICTWRGSHILPPLPQTDTAIAVFVCCLPRKGIVLRPIWNWHFYRPRSVCFVMSCFICILTTENSHILAHTPFDRWGDSQILLPWVLSSVNGHRFIQINHYEAKIREFWPAMLFPFILCCCF